MSKANIALSTRRHKYVEKMIGLVAADKSKYNQGNFPSPAEGASVCGTTFCAAGFLALAKSKKLFNSLCERTLAVGANVDYRSNKLWEIWAAAGAEILGISDDEDRTTSVDSLFGMSWGWPHPYSQMYRDARDAEDRFKAFRARWKAYLRDSDYDLDVRWVKGAAIERQRNRKS